MVVGAMGSWYIALKEHKRAVCVCVYAREGVCRLSPVDVSKSTVKNKTKSGLIYMCVD